MRVVTLVSLGASAVLGVAALFVAKTWLPASAAAKPGPAPVAQVVRTTPVVVAAKSLPYGTKLQAKDLVLVQMPPNAAPEGAFTTIDAVLSQDHGAAPVAITPIAERETLLPAKLSGPGARASVAAVIDPGKRAYAIRVTDVSGVGGNALPGDRVDVVLLRDLTKDGPQRTYVSEVVLQNVRVLGMDLNVDPASTTTSVHATATLEVAVADAQKLAMTTELGALSLALRRTGGAETEAIRPLRASELKLAGGPAVSAKPRPATAPTAAAAPPVKNSIIIVHGDKRDPVNVPSESVRGGV